MESAAATAATTKDTAASLDAQWYLDVYDDLRRNGVESTEDAQEHWNACGRAEGRWPSAQSMIAAGARVPYKYDIAIACMFRNAVLFLREWLEYHKLVGVRHFYLCNHLSTDAFLDVLRPYIERGEVELEHTHVIAPPGETEFEHQVHTPFYERVIHRTRFSVRWLACLDSDEFLVPVRIGASLRDSLAHFETPAYGGVCVNWQCYGTSNVHRVPADRLLTEMLVRRAPTDALVNRHVKSIVRPCAVRTMRSPHFAEYYEPLRSVTTNYAPCSEPSTRAVVVHHLRINHYCNGDRHHFDTVKLPFYRRYCPADKFAREIMPRHAQLNDLEDRIMTRYALPLRAAVLPVHERNAASDGSLPMYTLAVCVHLHNYALWPELRVYLAHITVPFDMYVTLPYDEDTQEHVTAATVSTARVDRACRERQRDALLIEYPHAIVLLTPNRGMDVGGFLYAFEAMHACSAVQYTHVLKVHTKSNTAWRRTLLDSLLLNREMFAHALAQFADPAVAMVGAARWCLNNHELRQRFPTEDRFVLPLLHEAGLRAPPDDYQFIGGTMFLARVDVLQQWTTRIGDLSTFVARRLAPGKPISDDMSDRVPHSIERLFGALVSLRAQRIAALEPPPSSSSVDTEALRDATSAWLAELFFKDTKVPIEYARWISTRSTT